MRTVLALLAVLVLAPAAHGQQRSASATDPVGDTGPDATDLTSLRATYDPAGSLEIVAGLAKALSDTGSVEFRVYPRHEEQCSFTTGGVGELRIAADPAAGTATGVYDPDTGAYPAGTAALSADRRTLSVSISDPALAGRDFACVLAIGEPYQDEWAGFANGDTVFAQFPGYERAQCSDGLDNDADGLVDDADRGCEGFADSTEKLGATPKLSRKAARQVATLYAVLRTSTPADEVKLACKRRGRLVFRCRARGRLRGTTLVKRVREGDDYEDRVARWRVRRR